MSLLTRDQILGADDATYEDVPVPEWGGTVRIAKFSGARRDAYEQCIYKANGGKTSVDLDNLRAKLVAFSAVDVDGEPLFTTADIEALGRKSAAALDRCYKVASRLNVVEDRDVEEATGN